MATAADLDTYVRDNTSWLGSDKPMVRVYNSAAISIPNNANTALTFDTERYDNQNMHSTSSNTSRLTVPSGMGGKYLISVNVEFASNTTGVRDLILQVNGSTIIAKVRTAPGSNAVAWPVSASTIYALSAGDYVEALAFQNSGGALNVAASANYSPEFAAVWLGS